MDHYGVQPDILVAAKGATSGYAPFGFAAASGEVFEAIRAAAPSPTASPSATAPSARPWPGAVLRILEAERLVEASAAKGSHLLDLLRARLGEHPNVGDIRGRGLLVGLELVADRATRDPFPRSARLAERVARRARRARPAALLGDRQWPTASMATSMLLGPPFVISDEEMARAVELLAEALDAALAKLVLPSAT